MMYYTIIVTLFSLIPLSDTTLLWRINTNPPAYLLGTAHLPHGQLWPTISDTAKSAFFNCTHFLPEFDMTNFFSFTRFRMCINSNAASNTNHPPPPPPPPPPPKLVNPGDPSSSILDIYLTVEARRLGKIVTSLESVSMYCEFTKFQVNSLTRDLTSNGTKMEPPKRDDFEVVRRAYNCDLNFPGETFPPRPVVVTDKTLVQFHQQLQEIVERRDSEMSESIHNLLKEKSPNNRYFFAVGYIHLMSADGIVTKLKRDYKYSITRLCSDPPELRTNAGCQGRSWCDRMRR